MKNKAITADDLAEIAAWLSILGYSIGILAIEKAGQESQQEDKLKTAMNQMLKRFKS
ncbi:MAG: hypothetical protein ACE3L7_18870 [Candidatus Pristimantibacillus sp.]